MLATTSSLDTDIELLEQELACTRAHARALAEVGLLTRSDVAAVRRACDDLAARADVGAGDEDVHSLVERRLTEELGELGERIHAGRSRNDLVVTDLRLWCRARCEEAVTLISALLEEIGALAERHVDTVMPGYTHLQPAQPVSLAFHLLAHGWPLVRDAHRFGAARTSADVSTLGAGALAGTTLPLDLSLLARELRFPRTFDNAMDAVSDRDFACDFSYAAASCLLHLSRLGEDVVLWSSAEFGFVRLPDAWSTGSSMMPQKRNPDVAELARGRAASAIGALAGLLGLLKGVPLSYGRDLQEDKALVFSSWSKVRAGLRGMQGLLAGLEFDERRMAEAARAGGAWATDLVESLVARGVAFREAHRAVGRLVATLEQRDASLADASLEDLTGHHPRFEVSDLDVADPAVSVRRRDGPGGTAPERVREQVESLRTATAELGASQPSSGC